MIRSLSKIILLLGFLLFPVKMVLAQESVSDYLLTAFEDRNLLRYDRQINFLNPGNYRIPVIDELEVRSGNDEFTYEDLTLAVRLRPSNPWKIRRNNALFNATKKELNLRKQLEFKDNLIARYEDILDYLIEEELYNLEKKESDLISRKAEILQQNMESDLFDAKDFVESKLDQVEVLENLDKILVEWNQTKQEISATFGTSDFDWDNFKLISVATVDSISSLIANYSTNSPELELIAQRIEVAKQEVRLEKADFDIGYIQGEYFPYTNRDSEIGYSVGITIPIFQNNRNQIAERRLDEIELKSDLENEQYSDSVNRLIEYEYLKSLIVHHEIVEQQIKEIDLDKLTQNLARIEDYDPISFLRMEEGILKLEELRLKSKERVLEQYIEFLSAFNAVIQLPLVNYLSENLEEIR